MGLFENAEYFPSQNKDVLIESNVFENDFKRTEAVGLRCTINQNSSLKSDRKGRVLLKLGITFLTGILVSQILTWAVLLENIYIENSVLSRPHRIFILSVLVISFFYLLWLLYVVWNSKVVVLILTTIIEFIRLILMFMIPIIYFNKEEHTKLCNNTLNCAKFTLPITIYIFVNILMFILMIFLILKKIKKLEKARALE